MKKCYRLLCFLLVLVMLISCDSGNGTGEESSTTPQTEPVTEEVGTLIVRRGIPQYTIVYASTLASKYVDTVLRLQDTLKEYTNARINVKEETDERDASAKEILIGSTQYEESKSEKKKLKADAYAIAEVGSKIVIVGDTNEALEEAIYYFMEVLIPRNTKKVDGKVSLYHEDYRGKFIEPEELQFNGIPITEFSVVYSKDVPEMQENAEQLASRIGNVFKVTVPCYSDDREEQENEILVGLTNREMSAECFADMQVPLMSYRMVVKGSKVQFACPGAHSAAEMMTAFNSGYLMAISYRNLRDGVYLEKNLLEVTDQPWTEGTTLRVMTSNILADRWVGGRNYGSVAKRAEMYAAVLMVYRPSLIGVQESDDPWTVNLPYYIDYLSNYLYLDYEWIENTYEIESARYIPNMTSIIYSKKEFTLESSGMEEFTDFGHADYKLRVLTHAILTHNASGEKYALVNTHYDGDKWIGAREIVQQTALVNKIKSQYPGIHVFCTGDYNNHGGYNIQDLKDSLNMLTTKDMAKLSDTLVNELPGIPEGIYIDHIFTEKTNLVLRHETIDVNFASILSDHRLQYADIMVK